MYQKLQRKGYLRRDCVRDIKNDRNAFASIMLEKGEGDILITGLTRSYSSCIKSLMQIIGPKKDKRVLGMTIAVGEGNKTVIMSDTAIHVEPNAENLAKIAEETAEMARKIGQEPRVAFLSFSNFGQPQHAKTNVITEALKILEKKAVNFEVDGDMTPDIALNEELLKVYPFTKLSGPANCVIMPSLEAANISGKILKELGGGTLIGPVISGFEKPAQIVPMGSNVSEILNIAALASVE
jgi:malate dehydrogenase (oxaloacetate-decarboxylating)(NADP+)